MIRLFASDMDGTLLNDKGYISDRTINAVKKLQKHGIHFIVNTGRDYRAAKRRHTKHPRGMDEIQPCRQNPLVTGRTCGQSGETAPPRQPDLTRH